MNNIKHRLYLFATKHYTRVSHFPLFHLFWRWIVYPVYDVQIKIHGSEAVLPSTYHYPQLCREVTSFNNPYLQLVYQTFQNKQRKLVIVDVGAAIGDSFLLVNQNIPEAVETIFCVEGDAGFLNYLRKNIRGNGIVINELLSDAKEQIPSLVNIHPSTARAEGSKIRKATTLDSIWKENQLLKIDVLKIDVEGFDGRVLGGCQNILSQDQPNVIFEFHPWHLKATANSTTQPFEILNDNAYTLFVWFDKFGNYSHTQRGYSKESIKQIAEACFSKGSALDWHYDVIALPQDSTLPLDQLSECLFARAKRYPY